MKLQTIHCRALNLLIVSIGSFCIVFPFPALIHAMASSQIPTRPIRQKPSSEASLSSEVKFQSPQVPRIPPRPAARAIDRSEVNRDAFAPSPLNDPPFLPKTTSGESPHNGQVDNVSNSVQSPPDRPPSVKLPSIGQEGNEYADIVNMQQEPLLSKTLSGESETTTSHVGSDLPLHAPKPSLSQADQKARIQNVTHTDSFKAASYGVGRQPSTQPESQGRGLKSKSSTSFRSPSAASGERPDSTQPEHEGIPEIGIQVPMYPNAGDVQAPSPSLHGSFPPPSSAGLHSEGKPRHHGRTRSGREIFHGPPGSYGLHGHGFNATGKFERAWYEKHPEALVQEGVYSPALSNARGDYVLSSEELNKLVQDTATRGAGFGMCGVCENICRTDYYLGTKPDVVGLPDEQIGYMASEEYASRMASRPASSYATKAHGNNSQPHIDSPLRTANLSHDLSSKAASGARDVPEALQKLAESQDDSDVIHVGAPEGHYSKVSGGPGTLASTVDLGPKGGNTEHEGGYVDEQGHGVPILASDEVRPGSEWQKPAVAPVSEERRSSQDFGHRLGSRPGSTNASRPTSRPTSVHGYTGLSRFTSHEEHDTHTPLDDVDEYEPLFEDDEKTQKKPQTQVERLKHRPDAKRRFPSQDIWEDTPNSLQLQAEVQTPPPPEEQSVPSAQKSSGFEHPDAEAARKGETSEREKAKLIPNEERLAKSRFKPHIRDEMNRPSLSQRFPSQDIWEDSPDSARLETTVGEQRAEEDAGLVAGAVVQTSAAPRGQPRAGATTGASVQPQSIPGAFPITPLPLEEGLSKELHRLGTTEYGGTLGPSNTNLPAGSKATGSVSNQSTTGRSGLVSQPAGSTGSIGVDITTISGQYKESSASAPVFSDPPSIAEALGLESTMAGAPPVSSSLPISKSMINSPAVAATSSTFLPTQGSSDKVTGVSPIVISSSSIPDSKDTPSTGTIPASTATLDQKAEDKIGAVIASTPASIIRPDTEIRDSRNDGTSVTSVTIQNPEQNGVIGPHLGISGSTRESEDQSKVGGSPSQAPASISRLEGRAKISNDPAFASIEKSEDRSGKGAVRTSEDRSRIDGSLSTAFATSAKPEERAVTSADPASTSVQGSKDIPGDGFTRKSEDQSVISGTLGIESATVVNPDKRDIALPDSVSVSTQKSGDRSSEGVSTSTITASAKSDDSAVVGAQVPCISTGKPQRGSSAGDSRSTPTAVTKLDKPVTDAVPSSTSISGSEDEVGAGHSHLSATAFPKSDDKAIANASAISATTQRSEDVPGAGNSRSPAIVGTKSEERATLSATPVSALIHKSEDISNAGESSSTTAGANSGDQAVANAIPAPSASNSKSEDTSSKGYPPPTVTGSAKSDDETAAASATVQVPTNRTLPDATTASIPVSAKELEKRANDVATSRSSENLCTTQKSGASKSPPTDTSAAKLDNKATVNASLEPASTAIQKPGDRPFFSTTTAPTSVLPSALEREHADTASSRRSSLPTHQSNVRTKAGVFESIRDHKADSRAISQSGAGSVSSQRPEDKGVSRSSPFQKSEVRSIADAFDSLRGKKPQDRAVSGSQPATDSGSSQNPSDIAIRNSVPIQEPVLRTTADDSDFASGQKGDRAIADTQPATHATSVQGSEDKAVPSSFAAQKPVARAIAGAFNSFRGQVAEDRLLVGARPLRDHLFHEEARDRTINSPTGVSDSDTLQKVKESSKTSALPLSKSVSNLIADNRIAAGTSQAKGSASGQQSGDKPASTASDTQPVKGSASSQAADGKASSGIDSLPPAKDPVPNAKPAGAATSEAASAPPAEASISSQMPGGISVVANIPRARDSTSSQRTGGTPKSDSAGAPTTRDSISSQRAAGTPPVEVDVSKTRSQNAATPDFAEMPRPRVPAPIQPTGDKTKSDTADVSPTGDSVSSQRAAGKTAANATGILSVKDAISNSRLKDTAALAFARIPPARASATGQTSGNKTIGAPIGPPFRDSVSGQTAAKMAISDSTSISPAQDAILDPRSTDTTTSDVGTLMVAGASATLPVSEDETLAPTRGTAPVKDSISGRTVGDRTASDSGSMTSVKNSVSGQTARNRAGLNSASTTLVKGSASSHTSADKAEPEVTPTSKAILEPNSDVESISGTDQTPKERSAAKAGLVTYFVPRRKQDDKSFSDIHSLPSTFSSYSNERTYADLSAISGSTGTLEPHTTPAAGIAESDPKQSLREATTTSMPSNFTAVVQEAAKPGAEQSVRAESAPSGRDRSIQRTMSANDSSITDSIPAKTTQYNVGGHDPLSSTSTAPTKPQKDAASTGKTFSTSSTEPFEKSQHAAGSSVPFRGSLPHHMVQGLAVTTFIPSDVSVGQATSNNANMTTVIAPSIPPRPSTQNVPPVNIAHPPIPARPSKHHQSHPPQHSQDHAGYPYEHSHLSEAHHPLSEGSGERGLASPQNPPPEGQGRSPSESRKPPTIPSRPKPHHSHSQGRADKTHSFGSEEAAATGAPRRVFPSSHDTEGADSVSSIGSESRPGLEDLDTTRAPVTGGGEFGRQSSGSAGTPAIGIRSHSQEAHELSGKGHAAIHLTKHSSGTNGPPAPIGRKGGSTMSTVGATDETSHSSGDDRNVPGSHKQTHQALTAFADSSEGASQAEADEPDTADTATEQGAASQALGGGASLPPRLRGSDSSAIGVSPGAAGDVPLASHGGTREVTSPPGVPKVKPIVPARPGGSKIAALQAGFMSDLNNRLKLGPQTHVKSADKSVEEEQPEEKAPLADARKARAKGPTRRKPAASPSPNAEAAAGTIGEIDTAAATGGVEPGTSGSGGANVGARTGVQTTSPCAQPPSSIFQPICLWQVPNTGVFDPVHANFVETVEEPGSLDGAVEDRQSTVAKADVAPAASPEPSIEEADGHLVEPAKTAATEQKPEEAIAEREVEIEAIPAQDTAADTAA